MSTKTKEPVTAELYGEKWKMVYEKTGKQVFVGDVIEREDDEDILIVKGGRPPHKSGSSGRIYVNKHAEPPFDFGEYFPNVAGCKWVRL